MNTNRTHRVSVLGLLCRLAAPAFLLTLFLPASLESQGMRPNNPPPEVPAALIMWPETSSPYAIFVDKEEQKVLVYRTSDLSGPIAEYACSTGENHGPKMRENDKGTPQGVYFITSIHKERDLTPIYGPRAFPIDYPNPLDLKEGRCGFGIWFHGTNKPLQPYDTNGCIVLENGDIIALGKFINTFDTPVVISSRLELVDQVQLEKNRLALKLFIEGWRSSWEEKRVNDYMSFYGDMFFKTGNDRKSFREYKVELAERYETIRVDIDNLRLLWHDGTVLAMFNQHYRSDAFDSRGEKRLYLRKNQGEWKIIEEHFTATEERVLVAGRPEPEPTPSPDIMLIRELITRWESAWERQDLNAYIACYDNSFRARGMDLNAWKRHREQLNRRQNVVWVQISDLDIQIESPTQARATFKQDYRADDYSDFGLKELLLVKRGGVWRIRGEEWQELERSNP